jgi:hypothetical protein
MGPLVAQLLAALSQPPPTQPSFTSLSKLSSFTFTIGIWFCMSLDMELSEEVKSGLKLLSASLSLQVSPLFSITLRSESWISDLSMLSKRRFHLYL